MIDTPDTYLADFGVDVSGPSSSSGKGILDQPDAVLGADVPIMSTEYLLTIKTADFPELKDGDAMTVDGVAYTVRQAEKKDDAVFTNVLLSKVPS